MRIIGKDAIGVKRWGMSSARDNFYCIPCFCDKA
jgi:hypothetical protein